MQIIFGVDTYISNVLHDCDYTNHREKTEKMAKVKILDKEFETSIPEAEILKAIDGVAARINSELSDKNPLFVCVLNGAFVFAADLFRNITIEDAEITFMRMKSYVGTETSGTVTTVTGLLESVADRTVVIIEDIVDSGYTMKELVHQLKDDLGAKEVFVSCLLSKPNAIKVSGLKLDYVAMEIPNDFIVGYGLDYNEMGRNLPDIWVVA